ncbi:hypothetical protein PIB30_044892 [Stylosanthes scabra]|uniref:Uncharacterized protein n=1 Tax=Stylosanthes scabra TaxID=79078 RepID=A0ABU6TFP3_9FABA|nr:hypothetical protein [Stylosanthes scabra]
MAGRNAGHGRGGAPATRDPDINRLDATHHVAGALGFKTSQMLIPRSVIPSVPPPNVLLRYIREADFGGPLEMQTFDYDMPLLSALVERWRLVTSILFRTSLFYYIDVNSICENVMPALSCATVSSPFLTNNCWSLSLGVMCPNDDPRQHASSTNPCGCPKPTDAYP